MEFQDIDEVISRLIQLKKLETRYRQEDEKMKAERQREDAIIEEHLKDLQQRREAEDEALMQARKAENETLIRTHRRISEVLSSQTSTPEPIRPQPRAQIIGGHSEITSFMSSPPRTETRTQIATEKGAMNIIQTARRSSQRISLMGSAVADIGYESRMTRRQCSKDEVQPDDTVVKFRAQYYVLNECPECGMQYQPSHSDEMTILRKYNSHIRLSHFKSCFTLPGGFQAMLDVCGIKVKDGSDEWARRRDENSTHRDEIRSRQSGVLTTIEHINDTTAANRGVPSATQSPNWVSRRSSPAESVVREITNSSSNTSTKRKRDSRTSPTRRPESPSHQFARVELNRDDIGHRQPPFNRQSDLMSSLDVLNARTSPADIADKTSRIHERQPLLPLTNTPADQKRRSSGSHEGSLKEHFPTVNRGGTPFDYALWATRRDHGSPSFAGKVDPFGIFEDPATGRLVRRVSPERE